MAFHNIQFPTNISYGSKGGPGFRTNIVVTDSGSEQRVARWGNARRRYDVAYGIKSFQDLSTVKDFYTRRLGSAYAFRYKDFLDCTSSSTGLATELGGASPLNTDQSLGTGDGLTLTFPLIKRYTDATTSLVRNITKPVVGTTVIEVGGQDAIDRSGTVSIPDAGTTLNDFSATFQTWNIRSGQIIQNTSDGSTATIISVISQTQITHTALTGGAENDWDNAEAYTILAGWSVNELTGILTFTGAPESGDEIKAGFEFDVPCRFGDEIDDQFSVNIEDFSSGAVESIPLIEVLQEGSVNDDYFYGGSGAFTMDADISIVENNGRVIVVDATVPGLTVNLPSPAGLAAGGPKFYIVNLSTNAVTIQPNDGAATWTLPVDTMITVVLGGAKWYSAIL